MNKTQQKIAAGLETAFARQGFTEMGVDGLRDAAQVSLRTLYKYCPSKEEMILLALEYRHNRYISFLFSHLQAESDNVTAAMFERVGEWMLENDAQGCLFHDAVLSHPGSHRIKAMYEKHKGELADRLEQISKLTGKAGQLLLVHEGIVQSWPILRHRAVEIAMSLLQGITEADQTG